MPVEYPGEIREYCHMPVEYRVEIREFDNKFPVGTLRCVKLHHVIHICIRYYHLNPDTSCGDYIRHK